MKMTKYLINNDDVVRINQTLYTIAPHDYDNDNLASKSATKDYENRMIMDGVDAEIFHSGNDQKTTALMQGDIVESKLQPYLAFILIYDKLMPLHEAELLNKLHDTFNMLGEINDISDMLNELTSKVSSLEKQAHKGASTNE